MMAKRIAKATNWFGTIARLAFGVALLVAGITIATAEDLPRVARAGERHVLIVDGKPFLILGGQINNSSNYPAVLPKVWPVLRKLNANTIEAPVAWEQLEPVEGRFTFGWVDTLLEQARSNDMRVVLLWFGTWKNGESTYVPEWVKTNTSRFPRLERADGRVTMTLSPFGDATRAADSTAFAALMRHLRQVDPRNTVIMVQVENEIGTMGTPRDYLPKAQRAFDGPVPEAVRVAAGKTAGTWTQAFGKEADQAFAAWSYARYVATVVQAGKAEKRLPMYINAAVFDAVSTTLADKIASGGPNWNVLPIWKAVAPGLDLVGVDMYVPGAKSYLGLLDRYTRPDNALFVPESADTPAAARFFWAALGRGAIGWTPFGMDATDYNNFPLGARKLDPLTLETFAAPFRMFRPIASDWAAITATRPLWSTVKTDVAEQSTAMGRWRVTALYGANNFDIAGFRGEAPPWAGQMVGGGVVAQLAPDEFLIAGQYVRLRFTPQDATQNLQILSAEEGTFVKGQWQMMRRWNGDQISSGFNFNTEPVLLRVRLATFANPPH